MSFSISFWNVENFYGNKSRSKRVEEHVRDLTGTSNPPDIVSFCEVKDKTLMRRLLTKNLPEYDFGMSDTALIPKKRKKGRSQIEILVGWKRDLFDQVMYTQRIELTGGRTSIRPGVLLNVRQKTKWYSLLFLHTKSGPNTEAYNARRKQFYQMFRLKRKLDEIEPSGSGKNRARFLVIGDLNLMGNGSRGKPKRVSGDAEVQDLANLAKKNGMEMEFKEFPDTFNQRKPRKLRSNLDHVLTSDRIKLRQLGKTENGKPYTVRVSGWNQLLGDTKALHEFEDNYSDHSALYCEVIS